MEAEQIPSGDDSLLGKKQTKKGRSYPAPDVKFLFAASAGYCAFPDCKQRCVVKRTTLDKHAIIGEIAHIIAHSEDGPRGKANLTDKERDCYDNWVLLCPTHHTLVDKQANSYTAEDLKQWKTILEKSVTEKLEEEITNVTFVELEAVTKAILENASIPNTDFDIINIPEKLSKNQLTNKVRDYLAIGSVRYSQVEEYIQTISRIDITFPERLRDGFLFEYEKQLAEGVTGDALFLSLCVFSYQNKDSLLEQAACLAVLSYLFITCEIFEK
jgi:hypothetical protein